MTVTPILCYHGVGDDYPKTERPFSFPADVFAAHLDAIARRGLRTVTVGELMRLRHDGDEPSLARTVAITFDDGYADLLTTVAPLLVERQMVATAFLTTSFLDHRSAGRPSDDRWLSWDEARALRETGAFEIGAHSHDHVELDMLDVGDARRQIHACRDRIADELGARPTSFAYPYGYSTPTVQAMLREAGFMSACGVKHALSGADDVPMDLARVRLLRRHPLATATRWIEGQALRVAPCPDELRTRLYRPVRRLRHRARRRRDAASASH
jgi:peptidoglycan/xylan/chitin deacetylase (PgdA/CDA1 family)